MFCACTKKKPEQKTNYFKRNEFKQGKFFRLAQHMTYEELKDETARFEKSGDLDLAVKFISHMIKKCEDPTELRTLRLHMADLLYQTKRFADATQEYEMFAQLYPSSDQAPYAEFKAIQALNSQVLTADLDQEKTEKVVEKTKDFGRKAQTSPSYKQFVPQVEKIAHDALYRLYESEMLRFYFYLNRLQLKAASARLTWIKEHFARYLNELEPEILELECELASAQGDKKEAADKCTALAKKYPTYTKKPERKWHYALPF